MQKQSVLVSQILSSSGSSFLSSGSSSFSSTSCSDEEIYDSFLLFIQTASNQMADDVKDISAECQNLTQSIQDILNSHNADAYILGVLDKIVDIISSIIISQAQNETIKSYKCDSSLTNQTCSSVQKQKLPPATTSISRIVYKLFTGANKEKYAHTILNMQNSAQRVFMDLIEKQMCRRNNDKDLSEQASQIGTRNERFIECPELTLPIQGSISECEQVKNSQKKMRRSSEIQILPFNELFSKVLNLQEQNQILIEKVSQFSQNSTTLEKQNQQLKGLNRNLEQNIRQLNLKICALASQLESIQTDKLSQLNKIQKKWEGKMKIIQKNKEEQITELKEINESTKKKYDIKLSQFEQRLSIKREKIKKLYEKEQKLQNKVREQEQSMNGYKEEIKCLNQIISKNRQELNGFEIMRDQLLMELQMRNNRLEDMKLLLFSEHNRLAMTKEISMVGHNQDCTPNQFQWSVGTNDWKDSTHASKFQKLNLNPHYVNEVSVGSGYSWFKQSIRSKNKKLSLGSTEEDYNRHFESHVAYLNKKIQFLVKQNESCLKSLKIARDLKYQNKKLIKSLKEHQYYRGEQNQIITGCLYELRKICEQNFMEVGSVASLRSSLLHFKKNQAQINSDRNKENCSKEDINLANQV